MEKPDQIKEHKQFGFVREVILPIGSLIIALAGILLSAYSLTTQMWLQEYQIKYKGYGAIMGELRMAFYEPGQSSQSRWAHINKAWAEYYPLETYISNVDKRQDLRKSLVAVVMACEEAQKVYAKPSALENAQKVFLERQQMLGEELERHLGLGER